jgi:2-dehydropantoate 2-reductase
MKIAVMGSGGVGGYYGGLLARAGHDATFIARGAHLEALRANGLQVKSVHGDFDVPSTQATDDPAEVGPVDPVLVCVKTPDTAAVAHAIKPLVGPDTIVVSLQNGIDAAERFGEVVGVEHVLAGATWVSSAIATPGVIRQLSTFRRIVVGELDGRVTPRARSVVEAFKDTGVTVELSTDIRRVLWTKFVFISAISGVGSLTRLEIGEYRAVPETRSLLTNLMREVEALARANGVALDSDVVEGGLSIVDNAEPNIKPSMQRDVEAGRPSELEALIGVIGRQGRELGVPTPTADLVYAALLPRELKARKR